jgi:hypothetical protein
MGCALMTVGPMPYGVAQETDVEIGCSSDQNSAVTCCNSHSLEEELPGESAMLRRSFCQLLLLPTVSVLDNQGFLRQINPNTLSTEQELLTHSESNQPSLWWNRDILPERLGGNRLFESWLTYEIQDSGTQVVDIAVDPQIWRVLNYSEKYAVLNRLATTTESLGYNLRLFYAHPRASVLVGLYVCDFEDNTAAAKLNTSAYSDSYEISSCVTAFNPNAIAQYRYSLLDAEESPVAEAATPQEEGAVPQNTASR